VRDLGGPEFGAHLTRKMEEGLAERLGRVIDVTVL
jgi:hypothetical protein